MGRKTYWVVIALFMMFIGALLVSQGQTTQVVVATGGLCAVVIAFFAGVYWVIRIFVKMLVDR